MEWKAGTARWLVWHGESDSLFEVFNVAEVSHHMDQGCDEVTGIERFELEFKRRKHGITKENEMSKLELVVMAGAESKQFLADLTRQMDRAETLITKLEKLEGVTPTNATPGGDFDEEAPVKTAAKTTTKKTTTKKAAPPVAESFEDDDLADGPANASAGFDDDDFAQEAATESFDEELGDDDFMTEPTEAPAPKAKTAAAKKPAPKKYTTDDLNDACMARAKKEGGGKPGRDKVLNLMKKNFGVTSVQAIPATSYEKFMQVMTGTK